MEIWLIPVLLQINNNDWIQYCMCCRLETCAHACCEFCHSFIHSARWSLYGLVEWVESSCGSDSCVGLKKKTNKNTKQRELQASGYPSVLTRHRSQGKCFRLSRSVGTHHSTITANIQRCSCLQPHNLEYSLPLAVTCLQNKKLFCTTSRQTANQTT